MDVIDVVFYTNIYTSKKNCIILKINRHDITSSVFSCGAA